MNILTNLEVLLVSGGSPSERFQGPPLRVDSIDWRAIDGWGELIPLPTPGCVEIAAV